MSKIKKFFLISIFSFLFLPLVNADVSFYELDSSRWFSALSVFKSNYPNWTSSKIESICDDLISKYADNNYYTCSFTLRSGGGGPFVNFGLSSGNTYWVPQFFLLTYSTDNQFVVHYDNNSKYLSFSNNSIVSGKSFMYDNNFNIVSTSSDSSLYDWFPSNIFASGGWIKFVNIVKSNFSNQSFLFSDSNFKVNGNFFGKDYGSISFRDMLNITFNNFFPSSFPDASNEKGSYRFDSFAYFIKDFDLGTDKRLKLHFNFMDHIDSDKINIYVNNNGNYISHNLKCLKVSNPKITQCDLDIKYNVNNDRSIALFFDFDKVYDFVFFDSDNNNVNSAFIPTTDNIKRYSVYRDFSLLNKRGVGFYVDDSRILKFINSSYDFKFYKLIEMCGLINCTPFEISSSNSLSNDLKGLSYSNTYLNFVNDKYVVPNSSNFLKLSFNNSNLVKFTFNKDLVSNNVFPLFLVLNSDIGNNPNEEVYPNYIVQYNSSIFNYFLIKQNLVLSDNGNYYDDNFDSGTTINITDKDGVQKDYTVSPGDSGFQLFSDVDISSYYKNSLDYFKDKIITMFDLVSDLFGSFSVKVKYFFVLMFMLVVGLIIIRLLL